MSDLTVKELKETMRALRDYGLPPRYTQMVHDAIHEIERMRAAGDALSSFVCVWMPHVGWTTADRDTAAAVSDKWQEARRG